MTDEKRSHRTAPDSGLSRRGFLASAGLGAVGLAAAGGAPAAAAEPPSDHPRRRQASRSPLRINGREHRLLVEPRWRSPTCCATSSA